LTGEATSVIHYHYTGWPDFGVPENSNVLIQLVLDLKQLQHHMTVVHCSAGVGRTGTFFAMSRIMDEIDNDVQSIDVFSTVLALRKDRRFMVTFCLRPSTKLMASGIGMTILHPPHPSLPTVEEMTSKTLN
jgi:protein tyrosine phosphatase